jgi:glycosyltransferase involved in cell wall biosynthesis
MASTSEGGAAAAARPRIVFDGLNLSLKQGTGIATYTRTLTRVAGHLGYQVGVVYSTPFTPARDPKLREIAFFDEKRAPQQLGTKRTPRRMLNYLLDQARYHFPVAAAPLSFSGTVITDHFADLLPQQEFGFVARNLFNNAWDFYRRTGKFVRLALDPAPDIFHCTCPLPLRVPGARNIYTIHDLVPLRLPYSTRDNKRRTYRMLEQIVAGADHIVTVSETSRRDIIDLLRVAPDRITNTYQATSFPPGCLAQSEASVAGYVEGTLGLAPDDYLLFFGAIEPKKNVGRLLEAYFRSGVRTPLVLVTSRGWDNEREIALIEQHQRSSPLRPEGGPALCYLDHVGLSALVSLIRGARAVVFPSLYEGFGLPVVEAMMLGTPVVTSSAGALPEIAGDAALLVDPYNVDDIAQAICTIVADADLRRELSARGRRQAERFSVAAYEKRIAPLYRQFY